VLVGWDFGGVLAYATAQALRRSGREVAQLIIIDCAVPVGEQWSDDDELDGIDVPVLLVRAEPADEPTDQDRTWGWGSVVGPDLGFASVAATHHGILRRPAVTELAELIGRELEA
jgi:thioesterase domain-containing protein